MLLVWLLGCGPIFSDPGPASSACVGPDQMRDVVATAAPADGSVRWAVDGATSPAHVQLTEVAVAEDCAEPGEMVVDAVLRVEGEVAVEGQGTLEVQRSGAAWLEVQGTAGPAYAAAVGQPAWLAIAREGSVWTGEFGHMAGEPEGEFAPSY